MASLNLTAENHRSATDACAELDLALTTTDAVPVDHDGAGGADGAVLLAVLHEFSSVDEIDTTTVARARDEGIHVLGIARAWSGTVVHEAIRRGHAVVLGPSPSSARLVKSLRYLSEIATPNAAQALVHDPVERTVRGDSPLPVALADDESELLTRLAAEPGRIVRRERIDGLGSRSSSQLVSALKGKLDLAGSHAKILKVPHMGYRLVGTVAESSR